MVQKVLILGSGGLMIGQAGEFDYSTSQCLKALKEEQIESVLINPNIATYQTSEELADRIYFLPITPKFVAKIIEKEKPDGLLIGFGGQTALNCAVALHKDGVLDRLGVKVLGTQVSSIIKTEDRDEFRKALDEINADTAESIAVSSVSDAIEAASTIGLPVMIRAAFALGGKGSGLAKTVKDVEELVSKALAVVPQVLVEEWLGGWKEIEYEVVRDTFDNCITVCNMENFDPMGIHTGESIVVAPSQTLTNEEYHFLREVSIRVIRHLKIVGECNIQFALNPQKLEYRIIEVNARLSRSSALASKATGYPLAFVATKLSLGYGLTDIQNSITKATTACFEPALDYVVVKVPRWDLNKFRRVSRRIGSEMKSVGEVMAIGRSFEEAFQKALRMLDQGLHGFTCNTIIPIDNLEQALKEPTDLRVLALYDAMAKGMGLNTIHTLSRIDMWFLEKLQRLVRVHNELKEVDYRSLSKEELRVAKALGFSDKQLGKIWGIAEEVVCKQRHALGVHPVVKQIDTLAAEYPAKTNYLYLTYNGEADDIVPLPDKPVMVLGGGPYRIGSSVEFDWCCVTAVRTLSAANKKSVMVNCNPETVSTDYDMCDRLYFEELTLETIEEIYKKEKAYGIVVSMGGQTPNNLALPCYDRGLHILGTEPSSIDKAENRHKFSQLLDDLGIDQPPWRELSTLQDVLGFADSVGYPVLIRPSYVLSGAAMAVVQNHKELEMYVKAAVAVSPEHPVVVSKFVTNSKEIEVDAVAKEGKLISWVLGEHVENAGVHSGDATIIIPAQKLYTRTVGVIQRNVEQIAKALNISGPFNIQFLAKDNNVMVIECNLRASRSFPFSSKVTRVNLIDAATRAIIGEEITERVAGGLLLPYVGVKAPKFSFSRLKGADPVLSVEMASTGEVACFGESLEEAFLKSIIATGHFLPKKHVMISVSGDPARYRLLDSLRQLAEREFLFYATQHTADFLQEHGIQCSVISKVHESAENNALELLKRGKIELVVNISEDISLEEWEDEYQIRRLAVDYGVPLLTNLQLAKLFIDGIMMIKEDDLQIKSWEEYNASEQQ